MDKQSAVSKLHPVPSKSRLLYVNGELAGLLTPQITWNNIKKLVSVEILSDPDLKVRSSEDAIFYETGRNRLEKVIHFHSAPGIFLS